MADLYISLAILTNVSAGLFVVTVWIGKRIKPFQLNLLASQPRCWQVPLR